MAFEVGGNFGGNMRLEAFISRGEHRDRTRGDRINQSSYIQFRKIAHLGLKESPVLRSATPIKSRQRTAGIMQRGPFHNRRGNVIGRD